jgi:hypothetical protein
VVTPQLRGGSGGNSRVVPGWFRVVPGGSGPFPRLSAQAPMQYYVGFITIPGKAPGGSAATDTPFYIIKRENSVGHGHCEGSVAGMYLRGSAVPP